MTETNNVKCPGTHVRYRVQRLIRMGEWLEHNAPILVALFDSVNDAHDRACDSKGDDTLALEAITMDQNAPLHALVNVLSVLRRDNWDVEHGKDVTLCQQWARKEHRYQVVIKAPQPKNND